MTRAPLAILSLVLSICLGCSSSSPKGGGGGDGGQDAGPTGCNAGLTLCSGSCVDTRQSDSHCGSCDNACAMGSGCAGSQCYTRSCGTLTCSSSEVCVSNTCVDRLCFGVICPGGQACAAGACYPTMCTTGACGTFQVCVNDTCTDSTCVNVQCPSGSACRGGFCGADTCSDGVRNGTETDVDCGGDFCPPCASGKLCSTATDCANRRCDAGVCSTASCSDGLLNGNEGDVDCGGDCPPCPDGKSCTTGLQCQSGSCQQQTCAAASCTDAVMNGNETDTDCGGSCPKCADGKTCGLGGDCGSGYCTMNVCTPVACHDGAQDGGESDIDCGGPCAPCATGQKCGMPSDCVNHVCTGGHCLPPSCTDMAKNGTETDVDCGGNCPACPTGKGCKLGADCVQKVCSGADGGVCLAATCSDATRNGSESDVDCGGPMCMGCLTGKFCFMNTDCLGNLCDGGYCGVVPIFGAIAPYLLPAGAGPSGMVMTDLDKDGLPDVAVANQTSYDITLWYGLADGGFVSSGAVQYSASGYAGPYGLVSGDFNGDGKIDLASNSDAFPGSGCKATVLYGAGSRNFLPAADTYSSGQPCRTPGVGDINGDGFDDLLPSSLIYFSSAGGFWVFPGAPAGLGAGVHTDVGGPDGIVVSDLNRDGHQDVLVHNDGASAVYVHPGNASLSPDAGQTVGFSAGAGEVAVVDLNADTYPDLAVATGSSNRVGVALGVGDGTFLAPQSYTVNGPGGLAVADVDSDGKPDLVVGTTSLAVLIGNGDGTYQPALYFGAAYGGGQVISVKVKDLNGDGKPDALALTSSGVWVVLNTHY